MGRRRRRGRNEGVLDNDGGLKGARCGNYMKWLMRGSYELNESIYRRSGGDMAFCCKYCDVT